MCAYPRRPAWLGDGSPGAVDRCLPRQLGVGLLSHGDQRLLEVAMALAQGPRVLLLDEPTQGLSVEETRTAVETLAGLLADGSLTVLLVEHDMEVVFKLARKITVLHRGSVIADDVPDVVKADPAVQDAYLGGYA